MTLDQIMEKADEGLKMEMRLALSRSMKRGGALADVEYELQEIGKKLEKIGISKKVFYKAFLNAHSGN